MKLKRRTLSMIKVWVLRIALLTIVFGAWYMYAYTDTFTITSYDITGINDDKKGLISGALVELSKKKTLGFIPKNKIFTYSSSGVVATVRTDIPELKSIDMRPVGLHDVRIEVTLLAPLFRVSDTEAITSDGIIFQTTNDLSDLPLLTVASSSRETVKIDGLPFTHLIANGDVTNTTLLQNILSMTTKVSSLIFPVANILVEETGDVTLSNISSTSQVMFLSDMDPKKEWSTLVSAIDTEPLKTKLATNKDGLLYLDARYGNKVFYRFNDMAFQNGKDIAILGDHASSTSSTTPETH